MYNIFIFYLEPPLSVLKKSLIVEDNADNKTTEKNETSISAPTIDASTLLTGNAYMLKNDMM